MKVRIKHFTTPYGLARWKLGWNKRAIVGVERQNKHPETKRNRKKKSFFRALYFVYFVDRIPLVTALATEADRGRVGTSPLLPRYLRVHRCLCSRMYHCPQGTEDYMSAFQAI